MNKTANQNKKNISTQGSLFKEITNRHRRYLFLGIPLTIIGFSLFFVTILLIINVGTLALIAVIPMAICIFLGLRMNIKYGHSGAGTAYRKVKSFLKTANVSALLSQTTLPLTSDSYTFLSENYLVNLYSIAALVDLNAQDITNIAINFYKRLVTEHIILNDAIIILKYLAKRDDKKTYLDYIS